MVRAGTKPSAPVSSSLTNRPGAGRAGNVPLERCADPVGEEMGEQPIECFALRLHGAPLGGGDLRADFGERRDVSMPAAARRRRD